MTVHHLISVGSTKVAMSNSVLLYTIKETPRVLVISTCKVKETDHPEYGLFLLIYKLELLILLSVTAN